MTAFSVCKVTTFFRKGKWLGSCLVVLLVGRLLVFLRDIGFGDVQADVACNVNRS